MTAAVRERIHGDGCLAELRQAYYQPRATAVQDSDYRLHWTDSTYLVVSRDSGVIVYASANDPQTLPVAPDETGRKKISRRKGKPTPDRPTDFPEFFRRLKAAGCTVEPRRKHILITAPGGETMTAPAIEPRDNRAVRNAISKARRDLGIDVSR